MNGDVYRGWESDMPEVLCQECPECGGWGVVRNPDSSEPDWQEILCETCQGRGVLGGPVEVVVLRDCGDDPF